MGLQALRDVHVQLPGVLAETGQCLIGPALGPPPGMEPLRPVLLALLEDQKCGAAVLPKAQEYNGQRSMEGGADIKVRKV